MPAPITRGTDVPGVSFVRLPTVPVDDVLGVLNEPRNTRHMPLSNTFDRASAQAWVEAKDAQWAEHGYGPWAILIDGELAGWGGFQCEPNGADFALVLLPPYWGHGAIVTVAALNLGFTAFGLHTVLIALPTSRHPDRVVRRFGFRPDGEVSYGGTTFRQFRLTRTSWEALPSTPQSKAARHQPPDSRIVR